ncbi:hypothetical protein CYMTET_18043 [Cymbomonas tetramitiformis]|uniref:Uncharacterized protein n=1 Tax=Cymbomonas tetramitiformis TaxID=36881 RepID=A0AAE0G8R3_9CHLO|nr:hypothetical protein CYMTET_18043 [Cymbomonas tetramitiformis]
MQGGHLPPQKLATTPNFERLRQPRAVFRAVQWPRAKNAKKTLAKPEASGKGKKADAERPTADRKGKHAATEDAHGSSEGEDAELSEEEDEVPAGRTVTVLVNPSEEPVDLTVERKGDLYSVKYVTLPVRTGNQCSSPCPSSRGPVVLANSPIDTVKHGQCEMPLPEDHLSLAAKQWRWTVTHKDTMAHVKKVFMAKFKPIEKLGGKNIKDADRMGKMLAEKILCGQCPGGLNLVVPTHHVINAVMAQPCRSHKASIDPDM